MLLLRAPFLVLDPDRILPDAALAIESGRVAAAGPARRLARRFGLPLRDLGDVVLAPGLVNAHTHLELSALRGKLRPTTDFAGWVRAQLAALARWSCADFVRSYRLGVRLALAAGTTAVGDICRRRGLLREGMRGSLRTVLHVEVIEPDPAAAGRAASEAFGAVSGAWGALIRGRRRFAGSLGFSPHAPYTVSGPLFRDVHRHARIVGDPVQTHLAETRAEAKFVRNGTGPLAALLTRAGRMLPFERPPGLTPVAYLDRLGVLRPPLVAVHCNYLTRADVATLARRRVTVVFCPRSHAFFRHDRHPVRALLRAGVPVALGTDSLASNRDLDVRAEMREVVGRYGVRPRAAWRMATENGARALRLDVEMTGLRKRPDGDLVPETRRCPAGTLRPGAPADMTVFRRPRGATAANLLERLLSPRTRVAGVWVGGVDAAANTWK